MNDESVVRLRGPRAVHDATRYQSLIIESERQADGRTAQVATVILTGRECPWRCVMCDLWTHTTTTDTPAGAIPAQIAFARRAIESSASRVTQIKLYNAGSFFDPRAVPEADFDSIAVLLHGFERVIVESHPSLIGSRVDRFLAALHRNRPPGAPPIALEVAMGLETAHPSALERLNKRMTAGDFARAADWLRSRGIALRVFLLIAPPFIAPAEQQQWLQTSVDVAVSCGATAIALIPTRGGNGAMEVLADSGQFRAPTLGDIERAVEAILPVARYEARLFVDVWDLDRFADCPDCFEERRARLMAMNLEQRTLPAIVCNRCAALA